MIARIEEQVASYQRGLSTAQLEAATAKSRLESLVVSEESARLEAKTGREELKRLRKEWLRMRDDLDAEIKAHGDTKGGLEAEVAGLRERVRVMSGQLVQVVGEAEEARRAASVSLAPEVAQGLREEVGAGFYLVWGRLCLHAACKPVAATCLLCTLVLDCWPLSSLCTPTWALSLRC